MIWSDKPFYWSATGLEPETTPTPSLTGTASGEATAAPDTRDGQTLVFGGPQEVLGCGKCEHEYKTRGNRKDCVKCGAYVIDVTDTSNCQSSVFLVSARASVCRVCGLTLDEHGVHVPSAEFFEDGLGG